LLGLGVPRLLFNVLHSDSAGAFPSLVATTMFLLFHLAALRALAENHER
jgi:hypothetical protein